MQAESRGSPRSCERPDICLEFPLEETRRDRRQCRHRLPMREQPICPKHLLATWRPSARIWCEIVRPCRTLITSPQGARSLGAPNHRHYVGFCPAASSTACAIGLGKVPFPRAKESSRSPGTPDFLIAPRRDKKISVVGGLGFEPRQAESESAVLPLDDPPTVRRAYPRAPARTRGADAWVSRPAGVAFALRPGQACRQKWTLWRLR